MNYFKYHIALVLAYSLPLIAGAQCGMPATSTPCIAPVLCSNAMANAYCGSTGAPNGQFNIPVNFPCYIEVNNEEWVSFVAGSTNLTLQIAVSNCTQMGVGTGLQAMILKSSNCDNLIGWSTAGGVWQLVSNCWQGAGIVENITLQANNLVVGQEYYILIDGYDGAICSYDFEVISGTIGFPLNAPPTGVVGPLTVCGGATATYTPTAVNGSNSFAWYLNNVPAGNVTLSGVNNSLSVQYENIGAPYTVQLCVEANNLCSVSQPYCFDVQVGNATTGVNPPDIVLCPGQTAAYNGVTYTYGNGTPAVQTIPVTLVSSTGCDSLVTLTVRRKQSTTGNKVVYLCPGQSFNVCGVAYSNPMVNTPVPCQTGNAAGCDSTLFLTIVINNVDAQIAPFGQLTCNNPTLTLTATPSLASGAKTYQWFSGGNLLNNGANTTVSTPGNYTVVVASTMLTPPPNPGSSVCYDTLTVSVTSDPAGFPPQPLINGPSSVCAGTTATYSVAPPPGVSQIIWNVNGGNIVSGQNSPTITVNWNASGTVSAVYQNACGNSVPGTLDVTLNNPIASAGADQTGCTGSPIEVNNTAVSVGQTGTWTAQPAAGTTGNAIISTTGATSATLTANQPGVYYAIWTVSAGGCSKADTVVVTVYSQINISNVNTNCNPTGTAFTATFQLTGASNYTVSTTQGGPPVGSVNAAGQFTSNPLPPGNYTFYASAPIACAASVQVSVNCNGCGSVAGQMPADTIKVCHSGTAQTAVVAGTAQLEANDIAVYVLHSGTAGNLGTIMQSNTTGTFSYGAGMSYNTVYHIAHIVGDNNGSGMVQMGAGDCFSVSNGQPVVFYPPVQQADAGNNYIVCGTIFTLTGNTPTPPAVGQWSGTGLTFTNPQQPTTQVSAPLGTYTATYTISLPGTPCFTSDVTQIEFAQGPAVNNITFNCDPTASFYTITFQTNAPAPYEVENVLTGTVEFSNSATFTTTPIASGSPYHFMITDINNCPTNFQGAYTCNCNSQVGILNTTPLSICGDGPAVLNYQPGSQILDGDDIQSFLVYQQGETVYDAFFEFFTPSLTFDPSIFDYGTTYNVVAVVGNDLGGIVDLGDPCLSVSNVLQVTFYQQPALTVGSFPATLCVGACAALPLSYTGALPYTLHLDNGAVWHIWSADTTVLLCAEPDGSTCFTSVSNTFCTKPLNTCVNYTVTPSAFAGTPLPPTQVCQGVPTTINLETLLVNETPGGSWTTNSVGLPPGSFNAALGTLATNALTAGTYNFTYTVAGNGSCPDNAAAVAVVVHPAPLATAGTDQTLTCTNNTASIGAPAVPGWSYTWSLNNQPTTLTGSPVQVGTPGTYTVLVTSPQGCTATGTVMVTADADLPTVNISTAGGVTQLTCLQNSITLTANAAAGVNYSWQLNGAALPGGNPTVNAVAAGTYTVIVTNPTNGCSASTGITLTQNTTPPMAIVQAPAALTCTNKQITLNTTGTSQGAHITLLWSGPGVVSVADPYQPIVNQAGNYTVTVTNNNNGCSTTATVQVVSNQALPQMTLSSGAITCADSTANLTAVVNTQGHPYIFQWFTNNGILAGDINSLTPEALQAGTYFFALTDLITGCTDTAQTTVVQLTDGPTQVVMDNKDAGCFGQCAGIIKIAEVIGGQPPYLYNFEGAGNTGVSTFVNLCAGEYEIVVTDAGGCTHVVTVALSQYPKVEITIGPDTLIDLGTGLTMSLETNAGPLQVAQIVWNELAVSCTNFDPACITQYVAPVFNSTYSVTLIDKNGCVATAKRTVTIRKERDVFIPNAFTPNDDEVNDRFLIFTDGSVKQILAVGIYDRWGNQVFLQEKLDPHTFTGWDGNYKDNPLPPGVYSYYFDLLFVDDVRMRYRGEVTLVR